MVVTVFVWPEPEDGVDTNDIDAPHDRTSTCASRVRETSPSTAPSSNDGAPVKFRTNLSESATIAPKSHDPTVL